MRGDSVTISLTKSIERPQSLGESPFLAKCCLVKAMVCEAVHGEFAYKSSITQSEQLYKCD